MEKPSVLILNSGGLDSLVVAKILHSQGYKIYSVHIDIGFSNKTRGIEASKIIADKYCELGHEVITVSSDKRDSFSTKNKCLTTERHSVPLNPVAIMGLGVIIAYNIDIKYIYTGHKTDSGRDLNDFRKSISTLIHSQTNREPIFILNPLQNYQTMDETFYRGLELGLSVEEMNLTISCVAKEPCGICKKCLDRIRLGLTPN